MKQRVLSTLLALCMVLAMLPPTALAAESSGACGDNAFWSLTDTGVLTISGSGPMTDYGYYSPANYPWYARRAEVKSIVIGGSVTSIAPSAFYGCSNAVSLTVTSKSLTSILRGAFRECKIQMINYSGTLDQWCKIDILSENYAYLYPAGGRMVINGSANYLAAGNCGDDVTWSLSSTGVLTISGSGPMTDYGYYSPNYYPWYSHRADVKSIVIGGSVTSIAPSAFYGCSNAVSLTVTSKSLTSILRGAFRECKIQMINYSGTVEEWCKIDVQTENYACLYPAGGRMVINGSSSYLAAGKLGDTSMWTLGSDGTLTVIGSGTMPDYGYYSPGNYPWYSHRADVKSIVIGGTLTSIAPSAFNGCSNMSSLTISAASLASILRGAFTGCTGITDIYYVGTQAEWVKVASDSSNNSFLANGTMHYSAPSAAPKQYTITFNANGGKVTPSSMKLSTGATYGENGFLPIPTRTGYIFSHWSTEANGGTTIVEKDTFMGFANQTIYAQWIPDPSAVPTMTVTFNPNGGSVATKTKTVTKGETYGSLPTPTRTGYKFSGWYTLSTGGTRVLATTKVTKSANHTLYAHWTENSTAGTVKVTLNANGGSVTTTSKSVTTGKTYGTLATPTRSGFKFLGWYTKATGGTKVLSTTKVSSTANHTLYAHWARQTYQVTFNPNGGTVLRSFNAVVSGSKYGSMPTPTYPGRHFLGWYTSATGGTKVTPTTKVTLTANKTLYAHWSTSGVTASTPKTETTRVTIPAYYELALYSTTSTPTPVNYQMYTRDTVLTCTRTATLSNGTVRYYAKVGTASYWFTYTDEMDLA